LVKFSPSYSQKQSVTFFYGSLCTYNNLIMRRLQNKVQQCITIKTTEMACDRNTRKAKTTRVSQHRMLDYKNML